MPNQPPDIMAGILKLGAELLWIVLAVIGGIARYLDSYLKGGHPPKLGLLIAHAAVAGFSGFMVAQTVLHFSPDWALVAAGVGGYMGTQGLDWITSLMRVRFGGDMPREDPNKPSGGSP
jgi:hypothetical protein